MSEYFARMEMKDFRSANFCDLPFGFQKAFPPTRLIARITGSASSGESPFRDWKSSALLTRQYAVLFLDRNLKILVSASVPTAPKAITTTVSRGRRSEGQASDEHNPSGVFVPREKDKKPDRLRL